MPTVRLDFELDSEVYPELHAALAALKSPRARAERVRQLAAAGLVWEKVRLHGPAAVVEPAPTAQGVPGTPALASMPAPVAPPTAPAPMPAPVAPPSPTRRRPRPSREEVEQVIRELPVLTDVVDEPGDMGEVPVVDPVDMAVDTGDIVHAEGDDDDEAVTLSASVLHVTALSHKPATRTRLMRMKERGLFKNG
ncbi:MAG: hypothetical protein KF891_19815 [Rhizobacter sp.]|nr:hypothetical protein [Rhizobacter sp.]